MPEHNLYDTPYDMLCLPVRVLARRVHGAVKKNKARGLMFLCFVSACASGVTHCILIATFRQRMPGR